MSSNGYEKFGRYSDDGREFVITRPDNTPRPWLNYAWSDHLLVSIDQCGGGMPCTATATGTVPSPAATASST